MIRNQSRQAFLIVLMMLSLSGRCFATQSDQLIPPNMKVSIELLSPISTQTGRKGDKFTCRLITPAEFAGAIVEGHIRGVKGSGKANKDSKIDLAFDRLVTTDGRIANFNATVVEVFDVKQVGDQGRADNEGLIRNKSTTVKTSVKRAVAGALIGAIVGGAIAGGQGAAVGAAIGAGLGVTTTLVTKGPDLEFKTGTQFTVVTDGPVRRRQPRAGESTVAALPVAYQPPAAPSLVTRLSSAESFTVAIPENWRDFSNKDSMLVSPDGGYKLTNAGPEITHGALIGITNAGKKDLKEATEIFVQAVQKANPYLDKREGLTFSTMIASPALTTTLSGKGKEGRIESVMVHTTLLSNERIFYIVAIVPEEEAAGYVESFRAMVQSVKLRQ